MLVSVEQRPHTLGELRLCLFDILPRRHTAHDCTRVYLFGSVAHGRSRCSPSRQPSVARVFSALPAFTPISDRLRPTTRAP